jgi:hypothetical protein
MAEAKNTGTWIDNKTGKVVTSQPEEGVQLIAPGVEVTPDDQRAVDAAKAAQAEAAEAAEAEKPAAKTAAK